MTTPYSTGAAPDKGATPTTATPPVVSRDHDRRLRQVEDEHAASAVGPGPLFDKLVAHNQPSRRARAKAPRPDWLTMSPDELRAHGTQCARLMILLLAGAVTDDLATANGVGRPAQRVADLRRDGVPITTTNARRGSAVIAVYRLERTP